MFWELSAHSTAINRFLGRMPVERTEHRGADELYKYYEVYETIGSGNDNINVFQKCKAQPVPYLFLCVV